VSDVRIFRNSAEKFAEPSLSINPANGCQVQLGNVCICASAMAKMLNWVHTDKHKGKHISTPGSHQRMHRMHRMLGV